jgi:hypothetical protein
MRYFSCVIRKLPRPDSFTKIKFPRATKPAAKLRQQHLHFLFHSLLHDLHYSVLHVGSLKLLFRAVNSNQLLLHSFLLKCFPTIFSFTLLGSLVFSFSFLWSVCLPGSCFYTFSFPSFSWSSFRKCLLFPGTLSQTQLKFLLHCRPDSLRMHWLVQLLTVRSVSDIGG